MAVRKQNLDQFQKIVTETGQPNLYFIRYMQEAFGTFVVTDDLTTINTSITNLQAKDITSTDGSVVITNGSLGIATDANLSVDEQVVLDSITTTQGSILYRNASDWVALTPGTNGQVLTTAGTAANPSWATLSGATGLTRTWLSLTNPGAESASTTGWTVTNVTAVTTKDSVTPFAGSYMFGAGAAATYDMYQDVSVSSHSTDIDAGNVEVLARCAFSQTDTTAERAGLYIEFYDNTPTLINKRLSEYNSEDDNGDHWQTLNIRWIVPSGTRTIRIGAAGYRLSGTNNNIAHDDFQLGLLID